MSIIASSSRQALVSGAVGATYALPITFNKPSNPFFSMFSTSSDKNNQANNNGRKKIVVFGGNGYVGQGIVRAALERGVDVLSISRSGKATGFTLPSNPQGNVAWEQGDIFNPDTYRTKLVGADCVLSCVGAFGSNEFMEKINGDANILAISEAQRAGVPRFVYISTVENNLPDFVLSGYFNGKRRTEKALADAFPQTGIALRPGFIYGDRVVPLSNDRSVSIPLWLMGKPLELITGLSPVQALRNVLPGMKAPLAQPIEVNNLGKVALKAALGELTISNEDRVMNINDIITASK